MTADAIIQFTESWPSLSSYWRAIILFGNNVASYKFALGSALLEIPKDRDLIKLEELALPYAKRIAGHLSHHDKQGTFQRSKFLDACRAHNRGEIDEDRLREETVRRGFQNVIEAFHNVERRELPSRFFIDERSTRKAIRVTDNLRRALEEVDPATLEEELDARWRLVETAWELNLPTNVLTVQYDQPTRSLVVPRRRRTVVTGARAALNGYQKGACFYCFGPLTLRSGAADVCEVDHVFPWSTGNLVAGAPVDGVWNLVLACRRCNSWSEKSNHPPHLRYVARLHRRNEYLIASNHPLRPTLIGQTGKTTNTRAATLRAAYAQVTLGGARQPWLASEEAKAVF